MQNQKNYLVWNGLLKKVFTLRLKIIKTLTAEVNYTK